MAEQHAMFVTNNILRLCKNFKTTCIMITVNLKFNTYGILN